MFQDWIWGCFDQGHGLDKGTAVALGYVLPAEFWTG